MIYHIIRPIVKFAFKLYFRKIHIVGLENIPKNKPMFCVSNHPTSFIEPCLMACYLPITFHFLVRGDLFSKKWLNWLLVGTNQIPIFRKRDGLYNVKKNLDTQERLKRLFQENKVILIFPEASTEEHMYLRPLKKWVARFSFKNENLDLQILPLGVNYHWSTPFNSEVTIRIGEAIQVDDFSSDKYESESLRITALMDTIRKGMESCVRHIKNTHNEAFLYKLFWIHSLKNAGSLFPFMDRSGASLEYQKNIIKAVEEDAIVLQKAEDLANKYESVKGIKPKFFQPLIMLFFAPFFIIGVVLQIIPVLVANYVVKTKIKSHEFKTSVFCAIWLVINLTIGLLALVLCFFNVKILLYYLIYVAVTIFASYYLKAFLRPWNYLFQSHKQRRLSDEMMAEDLSFLQNKNDFYGKEDKRIC